MLLSSNKEWNRKCYKKLGPLQISKQLISERPIDANV